MGKDGISRVSVLTLLLLMTCVHAYSIMISRSLAIATVYVDPSVTTVPVGGTFTVKINISGVVDLYGWEFKLGWNTTLLNATGVAEGSFLKQGGSSTFFASKIFNEDGYVVASCTLLGLVPGKNGSGTLATVSFYVEKAGECSLDLYDTKLVSSSEQPIPHQSVDGYGYFTKVHDVAIVNVKPSKSMVVLGYSVLINVTAENQGSYSETFNVTAYYNTTKIETQTVTNLASGSKIVLPFVWNTANVTVGNYTISARASQVPGETQISDNVFVDGIVTVYVLKGDINKDGVVDIFDIVIVAAAFGSTPPSDPRADLNKDGTVDIFDIVIVAADFGKTAW